MSTSPAQPITAGGGTGRVSGESPTPIEFIPGENGAVAAVKFERQKYDNGKWLPGRRMNGDEYNIKFTDEPSIRRVTLYSYR